MRSIFTLGYYYFCSKSALFAFWVCIFIYLLVNPVSAQVRAILSISQSSEAKIVEVVESGDIGQSVVSSSIKLVNKSDELRFLTPQSGSSLFIVKTGGILEISDIELRASSGAKSAIVLDGGSVILSECLISGDFASAIDVISGRLTIKKCAITGSDFALVARKGSQIEAEQVLFSSQNESAIWGDSAELSLVGVDFIDAGMNPVNVKSSSKFTLKDAYFEGEAERFIQLKDGGTNILTGLGFAGSANTAIFIKNAESVNISDISIPSTNIVAGIWIAGAGNVGISKASLKTRGRAIEVVNVTEQVQLSEIEISVPAEAIGIFAEGVDAFSLQDSSVIGGNIGLFLRGRFREFELSRTLFAGQKETTVQLWGKDVSQEYPVAVLENTLLSGTGAVLAFNGISRGIVENNRIASTAPAPIIGEIPDGISISGNLLLSDSQTDGSWTSRNGVVEVELLSGDQIRARDLLGNIENYEKSAFAEAIELLFGAPSKVSKTWSPRALSKAYGPYFVLRGPDGLLTRGPNLSLKSREGLVRVFDGLRRRQGLSRFVRRPGVNGAQVLSVARPALLELVAKPDFASKLSPGFQSQIYADLIAKFGDNADLDWLLGTFYSLSPDIAARAAIEIEIRMGTVNDGRIVQTARRLLDSGQATAAIALVKQLLRSGVPEGFILAEQIRSDLRGRSDAALEYRQFGLAEILLAAGPGYEGEAENFLADLGDIVEESLTDPDKYFVSSDNYSYDFAVAVLYLAKYAPDRYIRVASLPIPTAGKNWAIYQNYTDDLTLISADPTQILDYRFTGFEGPKAAQFRRAWYQVMGQISCNIIDVANPDQQDNLYVSASTYMAKLNRSVSFEDYEQRNSTDRRGIDRAMSDASKAGLSECILQNSLLDQLLLNFTKSKPRIDWWSTPDRLVKELSWAHEIENLEWVSSYSEMDVAQALGQSEFDAQLVRAIKLHHRSVTAAFRAEVEQVEFGVEIRRFRVQNQKIGEDSQLIVMGHVSIKPYIQGEKLLIGIKHNIFTNEIGGLSALMGADERAKFETPNRERMFEFIRLDIGGQITEGTFVNMGSENTLLYEFPIKGDFSDVVLRIGMRFLEKRWNLDYALYDSQAAHDFRLMEK